MFETFTAAIVLIVFLVPGYIWRTVEGQFVYLDKRLGWERFALGLLARSTASYAPFAALLYNGWQNDWLEKRPVTSTVLAILSLAVVPSICGLIAGIVRQIDCATWVIRKVGLRTFEQHQIPTAWDYLFSKIGPCWAIITLQNGAKLYGFIGAESYFSSDPDARDFFISHVLRPRADGIMEKVPGSAGVYVNKEQVSLIEFIRLEVENES
ncbi:MAG: DUF6338 family protein [Tepidisphaeraceae bacterium]|jgi:hypothetical protein